jgi:hypothetical protein
MKQVLEAKKLAKAKADSKSSQKVNDILQRLSSYTNNSSTTTGLKDTHRNSNRNARSNVKPHARLPKKLRSSSMSSVSSQASSFSSSSENNNNSANNNNNKSDYSANQSLDFSDFESSFDEDNCDEDGEDIDESDVEGEDEDPFKIHETCNHDLDASFDYEEGNISTSCTNKKKQSTFHDDSGMFSLDSPGQQQSMIGSIKLDSLFDSILGEEPTGTTFDNQNNMDSDDSDSLFSITKSVSVNTLQNFNSCGGGNISKR